MPDGRCRVCRRVAYLSDERGPVHLCCARLPEGATECAACRAAEIQAAEWERYGRRNAQRRAEIAARMFGHGA